MPLRSFAMFQPPTDSILPPVTTPSTLPHLGDLGDLSFHSPSQIVGTPFAVSSPPFEYPFPDTSLSSDAASISSTSNSPPFSFASMSTPPQAALVSASQPHLPAPPAPSLQHFPASFPPPAEWQHYSPTHPRMRMADPPIPPGLAKKAKRWSLGLWGRKRSASGDSQASEESPKSARSSSPDGTRARGRLVIEDTAAGYQSFAVTELSLPTIVAVSSTSPSSAATEGQTEDDSPAPAVL